MALGAALTVMKPPAAGRKATMSGVTGSDSSSAVWRYNAAAAMIKKPHRPTTGPYWQRRRLRESTPSDTNRSRSRRARSRRSSRTRCPALTRSRGTPCRAGPGGNGMQSRGHRRPRPSFSRPPFSAACVALSPASFTASPAFWAALSISLPARSAGPSLCDSRPRRERERRDEQRSAPQARDQATVISSRRLRQTGGRPRATRDRAGAKRRR